MHIPPYEVAHVHLYADKGVLTALEKAAAQEEKARQKGARRKDKAGDPPKVIPPTKSDAASDADTNSG